MVADSRKCTGHTRAVLSSEAVTTHRPSGLSATELTVFDWGRLEMRPGKRRFLEETLDAGINLQAGFALEAVRGDDVVEAGRRGNVWVS